MEILSGIFIHLSDLTRSSCEKLSALWPRQEKIIFFLEAQPGDKKFLQTNGVCCVFKTMVS
jgi:hypothetical protein